VYGKFDSTQLKALNEFLPTEDEEAGLKQYVQNASKNEATREESMNALCPTEKYMVAMMEVPGASDHFSCMMFQILFKSRVGEIKESIETLLKACGDVKNSVRLQKLMAVILTIGNQINTGGDGNMAEGFTLDALLKLNEVSFHRSLFSHIFSRIDSDTVHFTLRLRRSTKKQVFYNMSSK
jgi:hypothetical protein